MHWTHPQNIFGLDKKGDSRKTTLGAYIKRMRAGMTRSKPQYVFEDLAPMDTKDSRAGQTDLDEFGHNVTLREGIHAAYPWRPNFLRYPHDSQANILPAAHQFFVGAIGTGAPIHWVSQ